MGFSATFDHCLDLLACPRCKGAGLRRDGDKLTCQVVACGKRYPVVSGKPVLIDEERSVFSRALYSEAFSKTHTPSFSLRPWLRMPRLSVNLSAVRCLGRMRDALLGRSGRPTVLVVGGGIAGKGMAVLADEPAIRMINVDPDPASSAAIFGDAHDLPLANESIDGVVIQAVLEHVADPVRCVEEIHRVLKPAGLVYSEIPFMQQVHERGYDFTRFSLVGHCRLFRHFGELESGAVAGPGTALFWAWHYYCGAVLGSGVAAKWVARMSRPAGILLEQTDRLLGQRPRTLDAASCTYFFGSKSDRARPDRDILAGYRGAQR